MKENEKEARIGPFFKCKCNLNVKAKHDEVLEENTASTNIAKLFSKILQIRIRILNT